MRKLLLTIVLLAVPWPAGADPRPEFPDAPYRAQQPAAGPAPSLRLPKVETFTLANGLEVLLVSRHTLPTVQIDLELPGGAQLDPPGAEGQTGLCTQLVGESTEALPRQAFREALADLAASVSTWSNREQSGVSLSVLKGQLPQALNLWRDVLLHPGLNADDLARLTAQRKAAISQQKSNVAGLAGRLLSIVTYGAHHPLGRVATETSVAGATVPGCRALWERQAKPKGARLYIVGDLTRAEALALFKPLLAGWQGTAEKVTTLPPPGFQPRHIWLADVPGSAQAAIHVLHLGPSRQDADYPAVSLMAAILGGGFSSRINMNLREQHGWAYGARGNFDFQRHGSAWQVSASVRTDAAGPAIAEVFKEMQNMRDTLPTDDELHRERDGSVGGLPARWVTSASVLSALQALKWFGLPLDEDLKLAKRWQSTTPAQVREAARQHIRPQEASVLVVGDAQKVLPQLQALTAEGGPLAGVTVTRLGADGEAL